MVAQCQTQREAVTHSQTQTIRNLSDDLYMINLSEQISLPQCTFVLQQSPLPSEYGPQSDLPEVLAILWAKHKNHVGLANSALPRRVTLKANAKLQMIRQYTLPQKSIQVTEGIIQSLLDHGM